jgi:hypothetical protein
LREPIADDEVEAKALREEDLRVEESWLRKRSAVDRASKAARIAKAREESIEDSLEKAW